MASGSGWYFAHPQAKYFAVGKIDKEQVQSYSERKAQPKWRYYRKMVSAEFGV